MVGRWPSSEASRSHIAVWLSIGPSDRYSAIPSMNQSGGLTVMGGCPPPPPRPPPKTAYWDLCTLFCPLAGSGWAQETVNGSTRRCLKQPGTPPPPPPHG